MRAVRARGAGVALRADQLSRNAFESAIGMLRHLSFGTTARTLEIEATAMDPAAVLIQSIARLTS